MLEVSCANLHASFLHPSSITSSQGFSVYKWYSKAWGFSVCCTREHITSHQRYAFRSDHPWFLLSSWGWFEAWYGSRMSRMISSTPHWPFTGTQYRRRFRFKYFPSQYSTIGITTCTWSFQGTQFWCCVLMILLLFCERTALLCSWIRITREAWLMIKEPQFPSISTENHRIDTNGLSTGTTGRDSIDRCRTRQFPVSLARSIIRTGDGGHDRIQYQEIESLLFPSNYSFTFRSSIKFRPPRVYFFESRFFFRISLVLVFSVASLDLGWTDLLVLCRLVETSRRTVILQKKHNLHTSVRLFLLWSCWYARK